MTEKSTSDRDTSSFQNGRPRRRVVVSGLGLITPIGFTVDSYWQSLQKKKSGVKPISLFDTSTLPIKFAGEATEFNAKDYIDKKERKNLRVMARSIQLAVAAAQLARFDAGATADNVDPERFGVDFGAALMASELSELAGAARASANGRPGQVDLVKWGDEAIETIPPLWMLKYLPNMVACQVSIQQDAQGPCNTITEGDVSGTLALGEALRIVQRDQADFFLAGGADSKLNPLSIVRQCLFSPLSHRNAEPEKASRPFDRNRDGQVVGEGAGVLALEALEHAQKRGARIYAEVVGFGAAFDRGRNGAGLTRAIQAALAEAAIAPADLDHVNAHGLSTQPMDIREARAIHQAFGSLGGEVPVVAAKSYFGNLGAASGPAELIASVLALHFGMRPATLNCDEPDPECRLTVQKEPHPLMRPYILKTGMTDMGHSAALVLRQWEESGQQS